MFYVHETQFGKLDLTTRPKWYLDDGEPVSDEYLAEENYFLVNPQYPQDVDRRVFNILEKPIEEWVKTGNVYTKTYTITEKPAEDFVAWEQSRIRSRLDELRELKLREGFAWEFNGGTDYVQCGSQDISALTPLHVIAQEKAASGEGKSLMKLRSKSNKIHYIPATEMVELTTYAFSYNEQCYEETWAKKDQIDLIFAEVVAGTKSPEVAIAELDLILPTEGV